MKASDQIVQCEVCTRYAKAIAGKDYVEIYNIAWLKVREIELKNPEKKIRNYKTYFYSALRSVMIDQKRVISNKMPDASITMIEIEDDQNLDVWSIESSILHKWLNKPTKDKKVRFLQNIVNLALEIKNVKRASAKMNMSSRTYWKKLAIARQEIENEYFITFDCQPLNQFDLVRHTSTSNLVED